MDIPTILKGKQLKAKAKTELLSQSLLDGIFSVDELVTIAQAAKGADKGNCVEALELATKAQPSIATSACFNFAVIALTEKAPRVKWEAAKVIGNIAHLYPNQLDKAIQNLLTNTEDAGTVVRWSAAFALSAIIQLKTKHNQTLVPVVENICQVEIQNSIKKIYAAALKKIAAQ